MKHNSFYKKNMQDMFDAVNETIKNFRILESLKRRKRRNKHEQVQTRTRNH